MAGLNKKILCFVDETGTAGDPRFALGCVMVWARDCGKVDKAFSDLLPPSVNEVHAAEWKIETLHSLMGRFAQTDAPASLLMLNKRADVAADTRPVFYARALVETVKIGVRRFARAQRLRLPVGNVEVIVDANGQNTHPDFTEVIDRARAEDGLFRAVTRVIPLDSAASRTLQLADVVAHSRSWINSADLNAERLRQAFGIEIL